MSKDMGASVPDQALVQAPTPMVSALAGFDPSRCQNCGGEGWVCENHLDQPWAGMSARKYACDCGAGAPCPVCRPEMAFAGRMYSWQEMSAAPRDATVLAVIEPTEKNRVHKRADVLPVYIDEAGRVCDPGTWKPDVGISQGFFRARLWTALPSVPAIATEARRTETQKDRP